MSEPGRDRAVAGDIDRRLAIAIFLALAVLTAVLRLHTATEPLTMDTAIYGYIAHSMLEGGRLYTELWDHKPPGIFQLFMLSESLFGYNVMSIALTGVIFTLISSLFIFLFLKEISGRLAALFGVALWALASNSVLLQANENNVEVFLNTFTLIALWSYHRARSQRSARWFLITGLSFAVASLFKTIAVFPLLSICVYEFIAVVFDNDLKVGRGLSLAKRYLRPLVWLLLPGALMWIVVFLYFALLGRFTEFWQTVFVFNANYSGSILSNVWNFIVNPVLVFHEAYKDIWFLLLCALAWIFVSKKEYGVARLKRGFFIIFFLGIIVELSSPGKYFRHYYQLMIPLLCILSALFFTDLRRRLSTDKGSWGKFFFIAVIVLTFLNLAYYQVDYYSNSPRQISRIKHGEDAIRILEIGDFVKSHTTPCDKIYVWGGEVGIYYYSQRASVSGVFFIYPFYFTSEQVRNDKFKKIYTDIIVNPPALFIRSLDYSTIGADSLFELIDTRYRVIKSFKGVDIYELKGRVGSVDCGTS